MDVFHHGFLQGFWNCGLDRLIGGWGNLILNLFIAMEKLTVPFLLCLLHQGGINLLMPHRILHDLLVQKFDKIIELRDLLGQKFRSFNYLAKSDELVESV